MKGSDFIEMNKMAMEENRAIHEEFRFYRQSGLALSATFLALSGILFKVALDKLAFPLTHMYLTIVWFASLAMTCIAAIAIQFCHVMGYKNMASRHFPKPGWDENQWTNHSWNIANRWFKAGDASVWVATSGILIGFFAAVCLWLYL